MDTVKRTANFSQHEITILLELVSSCIDVIENKKTDLCSVKEKQAVWQQLATLFNASPGVTTRTAIKLKTCYENLKRRVRKDIADEKVEPHKYRYGKRTSIDKVQNPKLLEIMGGSVRPTRNSSDSETCNGDLILEVVNEEDIGDSSTPAILIASCEPTRSTPGSTEDPGTSLAQQMSIASTSKAPLFTNISDSETPAIPEVPQLTEAASGPRNWYSRYMPLKQKPKADQTHDVCKKRVQLLETQIQIMKKEHLEEMKVKKFKIMMLKQKLKYWKNKNADQ